MTWGVPYFGAALSVCSTLVVPTPVCPPLRYCLPSCVPYSGVACPYFMSPTLVAYRGAPQPDTLDGFLAELVDSEDIEHVAETSPSSRSFPTTTRTTRWSSGPRARWSMIGSATTRSSRGAPGPRASF